MGDEPLGPFQSAKGDETPLKRTKESQLPDRLLPPDGTKFALHIGGMIKQLKAVGRPLQPPFSFAWEHNQAVAPPDATRLGHFARDRVATSDILFQNGEVHECLVGVFHRAGTGQRIERATSLPSDALNPARHRAANV
jgi:hypothetical protein